MFTTHDWLSEPIPKLKPTYAAISRKYAAKEKCIGDRTQLILVDEADRLKMAGCAGDRKLLVPKSDLGALDTCRVRLKGETSCPV